MIIGGNVGTVIYFDGQNSEPDWAESASYIDFANVATTVTTAHTIGDGRLVLASGKILERKDGYSGDMAAAATVVCRDASTGAVTQFAVTHVNGTNVAFVTPSSGFSDIALAVGSEVQNNGNGWTTPTTAAGYNVFTGVFSESGRSCNVPNGMGSGQSYTQQVGSGRFPLYGPGNVWTFTAYGKGTILFTFTYSDGTNNTLTFTYSTTGFHQNTFVIPNPSAGAPVYVSNITWKVSGTTAGDPLRRYRVIVPARPGFADDFVTPYNANTANPDYFQLHPNWVSIYSRFPVVRGMDLANVNDATVSRWADRQATGWNNGLTGQLNYPYEKQIGLQNATGTTFWYNVPAHYEDAAVVSLANLIKNNIAAGLNCCIEYSNEIWNTGFRQYRKNCIDGINFSGNFLCGITYDSGTGLCTVAKTAHGLGSAGATAAVVVFGASDAGYNGDVTLTVVDANTLTYHPNSAPASSPATDASPQNRVGLLPQAQWFTVTGLTWDVTATTARLTVTAPGHPLVASGTGADTNSQIYLANVGEIKWNGFARASNITPSTFQLSLADYPRPIPDPLGAAGTGTLSSQTYSAATGSQMRAVKMMGNSVGGVVSVNNAIAYGYAYNWWRIFGLIAATVGPTFLPRVRFVCADQASSSSSNFTSKLTKYFAQWAATGGMPAGMVNIGSTAPYYSANPNQPAGDVAMVGTRLAVTSAAYNPGTGLVTVTLSAAPAVPLATGDSYLMYYFKDPNYNGTYTITATGTTTFTYAPLSAPVATAGASLGSNYSMSVVNNPPYQGVILSGTYNAGAGEATFVAPGHGNAAGAPVRTMNMKPDQYNVFGTVNRVIDANTFTVNLPSAPPGSAAASEASASTGMYYYRLAALDALFPSNDAWINTTLLTKISAALSSLTPNGMQYWCYECGQTDVGQGTTNQNNQILAQIYVDYNRDMRIQAQYARYFQALADNGAYCANQYDVISAGFNKSGSWGLLEYDTQPPSTAPKWLAIMGFTSKYVVAHASGYVVAKIGS